MQSETYKTEQREWYVPHRFADGTIRTYIINTMFLMPSSYEITQNLRTKSFELTDIKTSQKVKRLEDKVMTVISSPDFCRHSMHYMDFYNSAYNLLNSSYINKQDKLLILASPEIAGHLISSETAPSNLSFDFNNDSYEKCSSLLNSFVATLPNNWLNIVHSLAPKTIVPKEGSYDTKVDAPEKIILVNPAMPIDYGVSGFLKRGLINLISNPNALDSLKVFKNNYKANMRYLDNFSKLSMNDLHPKIDSDVLLITSTPTVKKNSSSDKSNYRLLFDRFFAYDQDGRSPLRDGRFRSFSHLRYTCGDHDTIINKPSGIIEMMQNNYFFNNYRV